MMKYIPYNTHVQLHSENLNLKGNLLILENSAFEIISYTVSDCEHMYSMVANRYSIMFHSRYGYVQPHAGIIIVHDNIHTFYCLVPK